MPIWNWLLKTRSGRLTLVIIGTLCLLSGLSLLEPIYGEVCTYNQYTDKEKCGQTYLVVAVLTHFFRLLDSTSAFVTAIATAILTWITWRLSTFESDSAKTTRAQLRAYVGLDCGGVLLDNPQPGRVTVWFRMKNSGATPAHKVAVWLKFATNISTAYPFASEESAQNESILWPGSTSNMSESLGINDVLLAEIVGKKSSFFVWGRAEYVDAFEQTHFFTFKCRMNGPTGSVLIDGRQFTGWGLTPIANGFHAD